MDNRWRAPVQVAECLGDVFEHPRHFRVIERALASAKRGEVFAFDLLHHQVERPLFLEVLDVSR